MSDPVRATESPIAVEVEEGKNYAWCSCGLSQKQPFCDGAHRNAPGDFKPTKFTAEETKKVFFCGCKATANSPLCDGSHKN